MKQKKKRNIFSYILLYISAFLLFLILLVSVTQTTAFKSWIKDFAAGKFNDIFGYKGAVLSIGSIEGNFFSEVIITDALLKLKNDEVAGFRRVKIDYNIFLLLNKEVEINELVLVNPSANFVKMVSPAGDTVWNIAYIFEAEEKKEEEGPSEFEWKINVRRLKIENLNLVMLGSKPGDIPVQALEILNEKNLNTENLKISSFNFETRLQYDKNAAQLWISYLGFKSNFGFDLKGLSGDFYISKSRAEINNLNIETSRSWLQMEYVFIDKVNLMNFEGLESFKGKDLRMNMVAKNFNFDDLKAFLPAVDFLDRDVYLELKCKGKFDDITIEKCALKTANSDLNFTGRMVNLVEPDKLWFDVEANNIKLDPEDTKIYIPGLPVPDYSHIGIVTGSLSYKGEPLDFHSTFDISSSLGSVKGFYDMNLKTSAIDYKTSVETKNINIGKFLKDPELESDITGKIDVEGRGFDLGSISTTVKYDLTDTKIYGQRIDKSSGVINMQGYNAEAEVNYVSGKFAAELKGNFNLRDFDNPVYNMKGRVANLDIAHFTKNEADKSNLTFAFDINGRGFSPENIEGEYNINLASSYYGRFDLPATPIDLKISTSGANDVLSLTSNLIDFRASGSFKLDQVGDVILSNILMIGNEISKKFDLDTLFPEQKTNISGSNMDFVYEMRTKNADAIAKIFFLSDLRFSGNLTGHIRNSEDGFNGNTNIRLDEFSYNDTVFAVKNAKAELQHYNNYSGYKFNPKGDFGSFNSIIDFNAEKVKISGNEYDSVKAVLKLENGLQLLDIWGVKDSSIKAGVRGEINLTGDTVLISFSDMNFYYHKFNLKNTDNIIIAYLPLRKDRTFDFKEFSLSSALLNTEFKGTLSLGGSSDFTADITNIDIPGLMQYAYAPLSVYAVKEADKFSTPISGKIRRLSLYFKGTVDDPLLNAEMNSGLLRYEQIKIGRINAFLDYSNLLLSTDMLVNNAQGEGSLRLTGGIPFSNPLTTPDSTAYSKVLTNPLSLSLKASNFQINFFSKVIPNFSEIRGFLNGQIEAGGTVTEPLLAGYATIEKGRFFFSWNGLYYRFETSMRADNSDLVVEQFKVYNDKNKNRFINIWGRINFAELGINNINLTSSGDLYLLDGSSIQNRFGFSGEMLAGIGDPPITIKGNLKDLNISGQLLIKKAKLFFPSVKGLAYDIYADDFNYRIITEPEKFGYLDTTIEISSENLENIDPFLRYNYELKSREPSIADFLSYDLDIVTEKNIYVNMIMNPLTREELFGEISGNFKLLNNTPDKSLQLFGDMDIVGDSYYRFYKNFKIKESKLIFNGDYLDPQIHINAEYKNVRTVEDGNEIMYVVLEIRGTRNKPQLTLKLRNEYGQDYTGSDMQSEALSYLIFGRPLNDINTATGKNIFSGISENVGTGIASSLLYQALREVAPFILNTELIYTGGDIKGTDIRITSGFGDAIVKFGGKIFSSFNNFEVSMEYPLNKLFNINVSNNLLLEISRELSNSILNYNQDFEYKVGVTYKIRY